MYHDGVARPEGRGAGPGAPAGDCVPVVPLEGRAAARAAGNLPGGDNKVLAGFEESSVTKSGYLWSAVTYDDAGAPTMAVIRDAESTLIMAESGDAIGRSSIQNAELRTTGRRPRRGRSRDRTPMVCRSGADRTVLTGVTEVVLPAAQGPEGAGGGDLAATIQPAFNTAAASETCATISTTSADGTTVSRPNTKVKVLWEVDGTFVAAEHGGSVDSARTYVLEIVNLAAANYEVQTGITLENDVFFDTRESALGHTYPDTKNAHQAFANFKSRWAADPFLRTKMEGFGVVSLISGQNPNLDTNKRTIGLAKLDSGCQYKGLGQESSPSSVNWLALSKSSECAVALLMHEMGHAFGAKHHDYTTAAVMHSVVGTHCSQTFLPVVREGVSAFVANNTDGAGCACAATTGPELPVPEPEQPVPEQPAPAGINQLEPP